MVIVSHEDLHLTPSPCVVQQYHDHQEMLYKVYVMEDDVMIFRRSSLPNLEEALHEAALPSFQQKPSYDSLGKSRSRSVKSASRNMGGLKSLSFDSRYKYPTIADFRIDATDSKVISISSSWDISNSVQTMGDADTRRGLKRTGAEDEMEVDLPVERGI